MGTAKVFHCCKLISKFHERLFLYLIAYHRRHKPINASIANYIEFHQKVLML